MVTGEQLKNAIRGTGKTIEEAAAQMKTTRQTLHNVFNRAEVPIDVLQNVKSFLGIDLLPKNQTKTVERREIERKNKFKPLPITKALAAIGTKSRHKLKPLSGTLGVDYSRMYKWFSGRANPEGDEIARMEKWLAEESTKDYSNSNDPKSKMLDIIEETEAKGLTRQEIAIGIGKSAEYLSQILSRGGNESAILMLQNQLDLVKANPQHIEVLRKKAADKIANPQPMRMKQGIKQPTENNHSPKEAKAALNEPLTAQSFQTLAEADKIKSEALLVANKNTAALLAQLERSETSTQAHTIEAGQSIPYDILELMAEALTKERFQSKPAAVSFLHKRLGEIQKKIQEENSRLGTDMKRTKMQ